MKKNEVKKKKQQCRKAGWAIAHFPALCQDTMYCILTCKGTGAQGSATRPCDTAGEGLRYGRDRPRHDWPRAEACDSSPARGLAGGVCRDTINCIVARRRPGH